MVLSRFDVAARSGPRASNGQMFSYQRLRNIRTCTRRSAFGNDMVIGAPRSGTYIPMQRMPNPACVRSGLVNSQHVRLMTFKKRADRDTR